MRDRADYYRDYLGKTVSLELPDAALQQAYDWARISRSRAREQSLFGSGLVAGYRPRESVSVRGSRGFLAGILCGLRLR